MSYQVCEPLYSANFNSKKKININQGGTSSAKTYTIMQVLHIKAATIPNLVISVVGQDVPNLKKGAIRDSQKIISTSPFLQSQLRDYGITRGYNKTERTHHYKNGSIIEFTSYDNEQDAKSGKRDYLFINEANGIPWEIYFQLSIRTTVQEFLDYNPSARFWVHDRLIGKSNVSLFISDHRHNRFLSKDKHEEIENIADLEHWKVYARGMTGKIQGLIYKDWSKIDVMPAFGLPKYGLDFGYNHKTALIQIEHNNNRLFWDEMIYDSELTISDLIGQMQTMNIGKAPIYADHAAPDKIEDLTRAGFNVHKADKDVTNGIDFVKRNGLYITKRSLGIIGEIMTYKYKVNKDGETSDEPVKFKDDAMDAARYGSYTGFRGPGKMVVADVSYDDSYSELDDL